MGIQKSNLNEQIIKNLINKNYGIEIMKIEKIGNITTRKYAKGINYEKTCTWSERATLDYKFKLKKEVFKTAGTQEYNLGVSGGNDKSNYSRFEPSSSKVSQSYTLSQNYLSNRLSRSIDLYPRRERKGSARMSGSGQSILS